MPKKPDLAGQPFEFTSHESKREFAEDAFHDLTNNWAGRTNFIKFGTKNIEVRIPRPEQLMDFVRMKFTGVINEDGLAEVEATFIIPPTDQKLELVGIRPIYASLKHKVWAALNEEGK